MRGGPRKATERKLKGMPSKKVQSAAVSPQATDKTDSVPDSELAVSFLQTTPKRGRKKKGATPAACLTSTPTHCSSTNILPDISESPSGATQLELRNSEICTQSEAPQRYSRRCKAKTQSKQTSDNATQTSRGRKRATKELICTNASALPAKRSRGRLQKIPVESLPSDNTTQSTQQSRPRFELKSDSEEQEESLLSSDLSIELSHYEEKLQSLSVQEDTESSDDEEEELPSFLMQEHKKPPSITGGVFVWHKFKNYPFWPALVKSVNRKQKKASVLFIDDPMIHKKKGFTVTLKTLKPFDCEEADELVCKAKENHDAVIEWSLELIRDYTIRIACGSFSGSFIEYFAHDMSYPVRRKYPQGDSKRLTIVSDSMMEALHDDHMDDSCGEEREVMSSKRLLPDRSHAAHNRANEKLVHFIVKQRMVDKRLLAIIRGEQRSKWLHSFLNQRRVVNIYLEDDHQLDQVFWYLNDLFASAVNSDSCPPRLKYVERAPFVLEVLLPEAIIYAIAGVEKVSVEKAEEKYLKGRSLSNREIQEFESMIDRQIKEKSELQKTSPALFSDVVD